MIEPKSSSDSTRCCAGFPRKPTRLKCRTGLPATVVGTRPPTPVGLMSAMPWLMAATATPVRVEAGRSDYRPRSADRQRARRERLQKRLLCRDPCSAPPAHSKPPAGDVRSERCPSRSPDGVFASSRGRYSVSIWYPYGIQTGHFCTILGTTEKHSQKEESLTP
jgi:hypothetical protein